MHVRVAIQLIDQLKQIFLAGISQQLMLVGIHPGFRGLLAFAAHVNLAGRIFSNQYHCEPRCQGMIVL